MSERTISQAQPNNHYRRNVTIGFIAILVLSITIASVPLYVRTHPTGYAVRVHPNDTSCWSGIASMDGRTDSYSGCGEQTIRLGSVCQIYISASMQKTSSGGTMSVELLKDGVTVERVAASDNYILIVSYAC